MVPAIMTPSVILNHVARLARVPKIKRGPFIRYLKGVIKRAEKDTLESRRASESPPPPYEKTSSPRSCGRALRRK
jgi:hypothetical protein